MGDPVPVWVGGSSAAARRRAAASGDGWIPLFIGPDELAEAYGHQDDETLAFGRQPTAVARSVVVPVAVGEGPDVAARGCDWLAGIYGLPPKAFERHLVSGPAEACAAGITRYFDAGATHVALFVASDHPVDEFAPVAAALAAAGPPVFEHAPERAEPAGVGA
jgi:alkanesulfonate monooxygenase SsuD/methylene tetrahydromethanopterin reductase-like flavin-dependent oxidoreductase (luciferase family)